MIAVGCVVRKMGFAYTGMVIRIISCMGVTMMMSVIQIMDMQLCFLHTQQRQREQ